MTLPYVAAIDDPFLRGRSIACGKEVLRPVVDVLPTVLIRLSGRERRGTIVLLTSIEVPVY